MLKSIALIPLGLLAMIIALEVLLQIGALVVRATGHEIPKTFTTGHVRVLCVGDSNTYGVWVGRDETYPQQVERIWNERHDAPKIEVLNLGYPGMNSSRLLRAFPRILRTFRPDYVIVMVGANDFWTEPVPAESPGENPPHPSFLARHSRLLKLFEIWRTSFGDYSLEVEPDPHRSQDSERGIARYGGEKFELGFTRSSSGNDGASIAPNVRRMIELAEEAGAWTLVLDYPSPRMLHGLARPMLREAATGTSAGLLDLAPLFADRCPSVYPPRGEVWCPEFMNVTDHPKANGYAIIAEAVVNTLEPRLLR